ncbi:MAG: type II toxin-antitoxin system RelE/ParE family toxin [Gallionellaceae bacterium]
MSVKKQLKFTRNAFSNIVAAEDYIAQDNPTAAAKVAQAIFKTAGQLEANPEIGRMGRVSGTRELPVKKYPFTLIYRIRGDAVVVYAVLHQSRLY